MNRSLRLLRPAVLRHQPPIAARPLPLVLAHGQRHAALSTLSAPRPVLPAQLPPPQLRAVVLFRGYATRKDTKEEAAKSPTDSLKGSKAAKHDAAGANPPPEQEQSAAGAARDEIRGMTRDVANLISGRSHMPSQMGAMESSSHSHGGSVADDFMTITSGIVQDVPKPALYFGAAGLLPYLGTSLGTIYLAREAALAANGNETIDITTALNSLHMLEHVQITYGAIILSFLGAIHWGMEFAHLGGEHGYRRLALGVLPVLYAWPTIFLSHGTALAAQWAGFTTMWYLDQRASINGWTTSWYSTYRFYLSIVVGFSIIATFAGTGYYGAGAGAVSTPHARHSQHTTERISPVARMDKMKVKDAHGGKQEGTVAGDMEVDEDESGEGYLKLRNVRKEEEEAEEARKEEEEKQKAQEAQAHEHDEREAQQIQEGHGIKKGQKVRTSDSDAAHDQSDKGMEGVKGDDKAGDEKKEQGDKKDEKAGKEDKEDGKEDDKKDDKKKK